MVESTKRRGDVTEANVVAELLGRGYDVYTPFGENTGVDAIVDTGDELLKVQIKTAWKDGNGCVQFRTSRTTSNMYETKRGTYDGEVDMFIAFCQERDEFYCLDIEDAGKDKFTIRHEDPERMTSQINWVEDYLLSERFK